MELFGFFLIVFAVSYPFFGGVLYGDPWLWILKKEE